MPLNFIYLQMTLGGTASCITMAVIKLALRQFINDNSTRTRHTHTQKEAHKKSDSRHAFLAVPLSIGQPFLSDPPKGRGDKGHCSWSYPSSCFCWPRQRRNLSTAMVGTATVEVLSGEPGKLSTKAI